MLFASRFTRATAARRFAVLSARFRRLAVLTARGIILAARLSAASLTLAAAPLTLPTTAAALLATVLDRFGFNGRIRLIAGNRDARDLFFQQALDIAQQLMLIHAHQR